MTLSDQKVRFQYNSEMGCRPSSTRYRGRPAKSLILCWFLALMLGQSFALNTVLRQGADGQMEAIQETIPELPDELQEIIDERL